LGDVVKSPVCLINGNAESSAMASVMFFRELRDWNALVIISNDFEQPVESGE
jgi:hypothetical protein